MARSPYYSPSPSLSPRSPTPAITDSSLDDITVLDGPLDADASASRPSSPQLFEGRTPEESVCCLWEDCGKPYSHLPTLIDHIHQDHIGVNKSTYTCEWATCPRRGLQQASRFALISHIRAHTGEKPFTCSLPECDKSFTRSDAMAKHMRLQHNISPPLPGRGGNRKRKRGDAGDGDAETNTVAAAASASSHGFGTFKVDDHTPTDADTLLDDGAPGEDRSDYFTRRPRSASAASEPSTATGADADHTHNHRAQNVDLDREDALPPHLAAALDPVTGTIFGRTPAQACYLVMKAKHRFALEQHESLLEELRVVRSEERRIREQKEAALDSVLRASLGAQAEFLIAPVSEITAHHRTARYGLTQTDVQPLQPGVDSMTYGNGSEMRRY